jgi:hypothetical protein
MDIRAGSWICLDIPTQIVLRFLLQTEHWEENAVGRVGCIGFYIPFTCVGDATYVCKS